MSQWTVLHIFHHYPPVVVGYARRSYEIVKNTRPFAKSTIITPPINKDKIPFQSTEPVDAQEAIYRLQLPIPPMRFIGYSFIQRYFFKKLLKKVFQRHSFDLVHAHIPYVYSLPALRYAKQKGLKTIYEVRGIWEDTAVAEGIIGRFSLYYARRRRNEGKAMKFADKVVVLSTALGSEIEKRGIPQEKIQCVPNAVDCSEFKPQTPSKEIQDRYQLKGKITLGYIGSLRKLEGIQKIIQLLPELIKKNENIVFLIIGLGEYKKELNRLVQELNLERHVLFVGAVSPENIPQYYSVCDILLFPRLKLRVTELVSPLKPLEAMAMGKCVLASAVGGLKEYCLEGVNATLFDPENEKEALKRLDSLIQNPTFRTELGEKARLWVIENKDWEKIALGYESIYNELCPKLKTQKK